MTSSVFPSVVSKRSGIRRRWSYFAAAALLALLCGCATEEKLPAEDLEVPLLYGDLIKVLQDPNIKPNSKEKYEAAKELILSRPELEGYLITDTGTWTSDGFKLRIP